MKVKIGNQIFDSYDQPIAVLFTSDEEIETAKRLSRQGRAIGSFPNTMDKNEAMVFLNTGWDGISYKVQYDLESVLSSIDLPQVPRLKVGT